MYMTLLAVGHDQGGEVKYLIRVVLQPKVYGKHFWGGVKYEAVTNIFNAWFYWNTVSFLIRLLGTWPSG